MTRSFKLGAARALPPSPALSDPNAPPLPPDLPALLQTTIRPYTHLDRRKGWIRLLSLGSFTWGLWLAAWLAGNFGLFLALSTLGGIAYGFLFVCTHEMAHNCLTGSPRLEAPIARIISWPLLWPYGTYCLVHRLHHRWNGCDLRDPERVQWTEAEYAQAPPWRQWYVRHQWVINILGAGGFGLIFNSFWQGWRCRNYYPQLRSAFLRQLLQDGLGSLTFHTIGFLWALSQGRGWDYGIFWLILERVVGVMMQSRAHLEHYGRWYPQTHPALTQLYSCRNLKVPAWVNWLMGGLPYHSLHHAYPQIPFDQLPAAFEAVQTVLANHHAPLLELDDRGYLYTTLQRAQATQVISSPFPRLSQSISEGSSIGSGNH
ncbi:MAG: fatty acid desaturase [Prochlorothrix sp.]|nr:fatty acid desaturase [Prochlorothrix sp.]